MKTLSQYVTANELETVVDAINAGTNKDLAISILQKGKTEAQEDLESIDSNFRLNDWSKAKEVESLEYVICETSDILDRIA